MSKIKQIAEKAINLGGQLQSVIEVGKVLDEIGDLEQAQEKAKVATFEAKENQMVVESDLSVLKDTLKNKQDELDLIKFNTDKVIHDADQTRIHILAQAKAESKDILDNAKNSAKRITTEIQERINTLSQTKNILISEVENLKTSLKNLRSKMQSLREQLNS